MMEGILTLWSVIGDSAAVVMVVLLWFLRKNDLRHIESSLDRLEKSINRHIQWHLNTDAKRN